MITIEEEVVLLYALYACGRKPSKARATHFILSNRLFKEREHDGQRVSTGESCVENRIAWTRQNLKQKGDLSMPEAGIWQITQKGATRIERIAVGFLTWQEPDDDLLHGLRWDRFSDQFLSRLKALGKQLVMSTAGELESMGM